MKPLKPEDFAIFFKAVYGDDKEPFPWQEKLAHRVATDDWPRGLALPTAAGKTACIDIAVFALACQSNRPVAERSAPRRIFFVVDRRIIVDEAFERANNLAKKLASAKSGILATVAERLWAVAGKGLLPNAYFDKDDRPLAVFRLRGGMYRDDSWAKTPLQPTVVTSTVDQIGSRLLYRGYGVGSMRPVHAGLAANDSIIILDEAHCAVPFRQTLEAVNRYRDWGREKVPSPFRLLVMSATPTGIAEKDLVRATEKDRKHKVLGKRIKAGKPCKLIIVEKAKGTKALSQLADALVANALDLAKGEPKVVGVIVNRVRTAETVAEGLRRSNDVVLLTGRMRPLDRDDLLQTWKPLITADDKRPRPQKPLFVVATQCLEVGANVDFDALVTECASLDALRQRFGRLNRLGQHVDAPAVIVIRGDQEGGKEDDPIYGSALKATWDWLSEQATAGVIDMGIAAVEQALSDSLGDESAPLAMLNMRSLDAPVMLPAHVDCWVQTAPAPTPDPDPALFLHGPQRGMPEVYVCFRADLGTAKPDDAAWLDAVAACPPSSLECLPVRLHDLRRWFSGENDREDRVASDLADVEGELVPEDEPSDIKPVGRKALVWRGPDNSEVVNSVTAIRVGDTVVVPLDADGVRQLGTFPPGRIQDQGDRAFRVSQRRAMLRLHPSVYEAWLSGSMREQLPNLISGDDVFVDESQLRVMLREFAAKETNPSWLRRVTNELAGDPKPIVRFRYPRLPAQDVESDDNEQSVPPGLVLRGSRLLPPIDDEDAAIADEDDSASATVPVPLDVHLDGVARFAKSFAEGAGMSTEIIQDMTLAASLHDVGKADSRFQAWLRGCSLAQAAVGQPLAKSGGLPQQPAARDAARQRSGYPRGGRHELVSVKLVESVAALLEKSHNRDLVMHLIASHHGHCRPFAPIVEDGEPIVVSHQFNDLALVANSDTELERLDSGIPERFWRLVRHFGWWGIAWLEAIFRLADHRCSEWEQAIAEESSR